MVAPGTAGGKQAEGRAVTTHARGTEALTLTPVLLRLTVLVRSLGRRRRGSRGDHGESPAGCDGLRQQNGADSRGLRTRLGENTGDAAREAGLCGCCDAGAGWGARRTQGGGGEGVCGPRAPFGFWKNKCLREGSRPCLLKIVFVDAGNKERVSEAGKS